RLLYDLPRPVRLEQLEEQSPRRSALLLPEPLIPPLRRLPEGSRNAADLPPPLSPQHLPLRLPPIPEPRQRELHERQRCSIPLQPPRHIPDDVHPLRLFQRIPRPRERLQHDLSRRIGIDPPHHIQVALGQPFQLRQRRNPSEEIVAHRSYDPYRILHPDPPT